MRKLNVGETIGGWTVEGDGMKGGNGRVYPVRRGGTRGALKVLVNTARPEGAQRFIREVETMASLPKHENVVSLLDASKDHTDLWYVMDWVDGGCLQSNRASYVGNLAGSVAVVAGAAAGVAHLHSQGIVHRDLKPDNILLREDGSAVVADLGLCWIREFSTERLSPKEGPTGAWGFRAPEHEHARVEQIDPSADVFSLLKILWWLLSGRPPFASAHFAGDEFDLTKLTDDIRMGQVMWLMTGTVSPSPSSRKLKNAGQLKIELDAILRRSNDGASAEKINGLVGRLRANDLKGDEARSLAASREAIKKRDANPLKQRWLDAARSLVDRLNEAERDAGGEDRWRVVEREERGINGVETIGISAGYVEAVLTLKRFGGKDDRYHEARFRRHHNGHQEKTWNVVQEVVGDRTEFVLSAAVLDPGAFWFSLAEEIAAMHIR